MPAKAKRASPPRKSPKKAKAPPKKAAKPRAKPAPAAASPAGIEEHLRAIGGWRGATLARMRALILEADPEMVEERKWAKPTNPAGVPVWSHDGIVCTGEAYKDHVKLTFARGASLPDPARLFNASLEGGTRRAIDLREGDRVDEDAFRALVKAAVASSVRRRRAEDKPRRNAAAMKGARGKRA